MTPIEEFLFEDGSEEKEQGSKKVDPRYLPPTERDERALDILRRAWRDIDEAVRRGDAEEAERLRKRFNEMLIEMGLVEKELEEEALRETMKLYLGLDREAPDVEIKEADFKRIAAAVDESVEDEVERRNIGLYRKKPGED
jgi:hypothetical protein